MFSKILHANDGSEHAFHALALALEIASQNNSEIHMVSVEEISYMPNSIEEIREETGTAARRFHTVLQRARAMAAEQNVTLTTHVIPGHAVRDILALATARRFCEGMSASVIQLAFTPPKSWCCHRICRSWSRSSTRRKRSTRSFRNWMA
jgi:nucleotide-binding universal stress UspA family protein